MIDSVPAEQWLPGSLQIDPVIDMFARGGNRVCYVDRTQPERCIKLPREGRLPAQKRRQKGWLGAMKPLTSFDDNLQELKVYQHIDRLVGEPAYQLVPRCFGFVDTNLGSGLVTELIRDDDGLISLSLKQYVWEFGETASLQRALAAFRQRWTALGMPSRNLLLHNIVVQQRDSEIDRLVVIDGLGWPDFLPLANYFPGMARRKAARKAARLPAAIRQLRKKQAEGKPWGYHGWMDDNQRCTGLSR